MNKNNSIFKFQKNFKFILCKNKRSLHMCDMYPLQFRLDLIIHKQFTVTYLLRTEILDLKCLLLDSMFKSEPDWF